jgi:hypothetical protein
MARRSYAGGAAALVLSGSITATTLSLTTTGTATGWPDGSGGQFLVVIDRGLATEEKLLVNSRTGNTLTVAATGDRGKDNTTAQSHGSGAAVEHAMGAMDLDEPNRHINTTTDDNHTQYMRTDGTRAFTALTAVGGTPGASAVADVAAAGTALTLARSDHKHGREAFATPVAAAVTGNAAGSAVTVPHSDHVHQGTGTLGYAETATAQTSISSETDLTSLAVTVTVVSGRRIKITGQTEITCDATAGAALGRIKEGATYLGQYANVAFGSGGETFQSMGCVILTPTAGSHTYKLTLAKSGGAGTVSMQTSATHPAFILVEDIGV